MGANATMTNEQALTQRTSFKENFGNKGVARDLSSIFTDNCKPSVGVFNESKAEFNKTTVDLGQNVDFQYKVDLTYKGAADMLDSTNDAKDEPNRKGPNLRVPILNPDGSVEVHGEGTVSPEAGGNRGFGTKISTNEEGVVVVKRYLERKGSEDSNVKLGEYFDSNSYDWAIPNQ